MTASSGSGTTGVGDRGLDVEDLRARVDGLARQALGGGIDAVERMAGGASGLTFRAEVQAPDAVTSVILKVAPPGLMPVRNRDVLRHARAMSALAGRPGVRVPRILFTDAGDPPDLPPLYAMSFEPGDCIEPIFDHGPLPGPDEVGGRMVAAARMMAGLHALDVSAPGLEGEPVIGLEAEVGRWVRAFGTVPDELKGRADEATELLLAAVPAPLPPVLVHGDYRLGNMLARGREVTSIIDWELWAVADPRLDLGWFLLHHDTAGNPHQRRPAPGMPSVDELVAVYETAAGRAVSDLPWFHALARFKQAAAGALLLKRSPVAREDPTAWQDGARRIRAEVEDAIALLEAVPGGRSR
jgi:aminoglycoside phosphotransferase (APT) family kinase protein